MTDLAQRIREELAQASALDLAAREHRKRAEAAKGNDYAAKERETVVPQVVGTLKDGVPKNKSAQAKATASKTNRARIMSVNRGRGPKCPSVHGATATAASGA